MDHRIGRIGFALLAGVVVAVSSFKWITNPEGREERVLQVAAVESCEFDHCGVQQVFPILVLPSCGPGMGVSPGDRVAVFAENSAHWLVADHAVQPGAGDRRPAGGGGGLGRLG